MRKMQTMTYWEYEGYKARTTNQSAYSGPFEYTGEGQDFIFGYDLADQWINPQPPKPLQLYGAPVNL